MVITIFCRFQDDDVQIVDDHYVDLEQAVLAALDLADRHGGDRGNGRGPPKSFDVWLNNRMELSVAVLHRGQVD